MNILFRKNFSGEGGGGGGGGGGGVFGGGKRRKAGARVRGRAAGLHSGQDEAILGSPFRTHIFLSPLQTFPAGIPQEGYGCGSGLDPVTGRPSPALPRPTRLHTPKVSFSSDGYTTTTSKPISLEPVPKADLADLQDLQRDCFIIPIASVDRFLPAGVPMPLVGGSRGRDVSVVEVEDPRLVLVVHLMTGLEPIEPVLESPLACPALQQQGAASSLLRELSTASPPAEGVLLANLEKNSEFPFISYYVINKSRSDPGEMFHLIREATLRKFDPRSLRYTALHTFDLFSEVATIARPPLGPPAPRPAPATGFLVSIFKVFEGDDGEKFEKNWLYWTGARMIYRSLPKTAGLRRMTLHKSQSSGDKLYLLIVECSNFLEDISAGAVLIPALRARLCGYTGLYRSIALF